MCEMLGLKKIGLCLSPWLFLGIVCSTVLAHKVVLTPPVKYSYSLRELYKDNSNGVDNVADHVTDYVNFCVDMIIPCKSIKQFSNNKHRVTKETKDCH